MNKCHLIFFAPPVTQNMKEIQHTTAFRGNPILVIEEQISELTHFKIVIVKNNLNKVKYR